MSRTIWKSLVRQCCIKCHNIANVKACCCNAGGDCTARPVRPMYLLAENQASESGQFQCCKFVLEQCNFWPPTPAGYKSVNFSVSTIDN